MTTTQSRETRDIRGAREPKEGREGRGARAPARAAQEAAAAFAASNNGAQGAPRTDRGSTTGSAGNAQGAWQGRASHGPHGPHDPQSPHASFSNENTDPPRPSTASHPETLNISLHEHGIGFFVPPGMVLRASTCNVPQGALIEGEFVGDLISEAGSVVIGAEASVYGSITADRIYIEGTVGSRRGQRSELMGRAMIAAGAQARINADMRSRAWSLHTGAQIWGSVSTIEDGLLGAKA